MKSHPGLTLPNSIGSYARTMIAATLLILGAAMFSIAASGGGGSASGKPSASTDNFQKGPAVDTSSVIVQLKGDPVSKFSSKSAPGKKIDFNNNTVKSYRAQLAAQRNDFKQWLQTYAPKAKITSQYDISLNAVAVQLNGTSRDTIAGAPMVQQVEYNALYHPDLSESYKIINAAGAWTAAGGLQGCGVAQNCGQHRHPAFGKCVNREPQPRIINIGNNHQVLDPRTAHRLQPCRLPDPAGGGVHDSPRIKRLLPARLTAVVLGTPNTNDQFLRPTTGQVRSDVIAERVVTAFVCANALAVDISLCLPGHRIQVQNYALAAPAGRDRKERTIPGPGMIRHDTGNRRLHRIRDQNVSRKCPIGWDWVGIGNAGFKLPDAIQVEPV